MCNGYLVLFVLVAMVQGLTCCFAGVFEPYFYKLLINFGLIWLYRSLALQGIFVVLDLWEGSVEMMEQLLPLGGEQQRQQQIPSGDDKQERQTSLGLG